VSCCQNRLQRRSSEPNPCPGRVGASIIDGDPVVAKSLTTCCKANLSFATYTLTFYCIDSKCMVQGDFFYHFANVFHWSFMLWVLRNTCRFFVTTKIVICCIHIIFCCMEISHFVAILCMNFY
jgi:hypothetical protein